MTFDVSFRPLCFACLVSTWYWALCVWWTSVRHKTHEGQRFCNNCCQGPAGIPGAPGAAGLPGRDGLNVKGDKGDPGTSAHTKKAAFTAIKTSSQTGNIGDVVTFQEVPTNINNHFNPATNLFTCQIAGTYVFSFAFGTHTSGGTNDIVIALVKNGNLVVAAHSRAADNSDFDHNSNLAILNLETGDQVWLQFTYYNGRTIYGNSYKYNTFSGYLLYED